MSDSFQNRNWVKYRLNHKWQQYAIKCNGKPIIYKCNGPSETLWTFLVTNGVRQEGILSPMSFNVFVDDVNIGLTNMKKGVILMDILLII